MEVKYWTDTAKVVVITAAQEESKHTDSYTGTAVRVKEWEG
jgi:hypothetical protein